MDLYKVKNFFTRTKTGRVPKWKWKLYILSNRFEHWFNFDFLLRRKIRLFFWWFKYMIPDLPADLNKILKDKRHTKKDILICLEKHRLKYWWKINS